MNAAKNGRSGLSSSANRRLYLWYGVLILFIVIIIGRLFYLQIIRHDYYKQQAYADQLKQYAIEPQRGIIQAHEGGQIVPLVLDQELYTLYADPTMVKNAKSDAEKLAAITGGNTNDYYKLMKTPHTRYAVLAHRLSKDQSDKIIRLKLAGVGTQGQSYRTYPQGSLASQLLGFVNNDGKGTYGVEQALEQRLAGKPGMLKAITDAGGVPLVASKDNIDVAPTPGDNVVLTIDLGMQKQLESILQQGLKDDKSSSGSALIMDPNTGAVKAVANFPTYDPSQYYNVSDPSVFNNAAVSSPLEVGSIMKTLTTSAALDMGVIQPNTAFDDPGQWLIDGHYITDIEEDRGIAHPSIEDVLNYSLNTGATWMLMQMGGGQINKQARERWHDYMTNHFQLGKLTGIEQGYEAPGYIPDPNHGDALNLTFANTAFGQAMTATPLQMAAAISSVINGGTYYQPRLVDEVISSSGKVKVEPPKVVKRNVVSPSVGSNIQSLMEGVVQGHLLAGYSYLRFPPSYIVGGKTGTAQIAKPSGGYYDDKFNGTYLGFVGGDKPQYVIIVRVNDPHKPGYAGADAAQPIFAQLAHMLINNFNVTPKAGP